MASRQSLPGMYLRQGDLKTYPDVLARMGAYTVDTLVGIDADAFKAGIDDMMSVERVDVAHHADPRVQRQLSIKFRWGHHHDFGPFQLNGGMAARHIKHMCVFSEHFGRDLDALDGQDVLEIGPWTGGVTLLLSTYGARVHAVEEVYKYVETLEYLTKSFGVETVTAECKSLYELTGDEYQDRFDTCMFAGVLYHITDPVVAMRILFNSLKDGGQIWVETTGVAAKAALWASERRQWNWFDPSPRALALVMQDVGFRDIKVGPVTPDGRIYAVGTREEHVDMRRDGLSVPTLR